MARSFRIITLGCKVNQFESAYIREAFLREGFNQAGGSEGADITVVNTCIVTQRAAYQSRQALRKAVRENPLGVTAAVGCYGQVYPEDLERIEGLDFVAGNRGKSEVPGLLMNHAKEKGPVRLCEAFGEGADFEVMPVAEFLDRTRAFLKIQEGCRSFCTYCIVPFARGPVRSLEPAGVLEALGRFAEKGYREVVLTGIHLGKYGEDLGAGTGLKALLRLIAGKALPLRIRLSSLDPNEMDEELVELVASEPRLCRHFHVSLQSGDDGVLRRMNRPYGSRQFARLVETIRESMPLAAVGVDAMVGFPGEGDRAFANTFALLRDLPVTYLHVFPFSPRKGTVAAGFPDRVDQRVIKDRARRLRQLGQVKRETFHRSCLGKAVSVLAEGRRREGGRMIRGWSDNYLPLLFPFPRLLRNEVVSVLPVKIEKGRVIGRILSPFDPLPSREGTERSAASAKKPGTHPKGGD
ncbi:MAG: tRNA (N(6)-L-threonylcarbamoyladenosine(37)-C(2))-methylthiotransferase MtaB [Deltaproteobacteria bacterium]|nr:tRNA (N(6)-L-threonylcarbamoyladenosine(37)-C(2))-methylthiotransferase MtaB [Deltaproteobacteria bacterium]